MAFSIISKRKAASFTKHIHKHTHTMHYTHTHSNLKTAAILSEFEIHSLFKEEENI